MSKYKTVNGQFPCHTCKEVVTILRMYFDTGDLTWMCSKKHMSKVELIKRRSNE